MRTCKCRLFATCQTWIAANASCTRLFWYARKPEDANVTHAGEDFQDEEDIETDEEDRGQHATEPKTQTNVPLPTATDVTQASVEQLSTLAVSDESKDKKDIAKDEIRKSETTPEVAAQSVAADEDKGKDGKSS